MKRLLSQKVISRFLFVVLFFFSTTISAQVPVITSVSPSSGPVGALISINGNDLNGATDLIVGGVSAIIISNDGTTLKGMVMPGAGSGDIRITTPGGSVTTGHAFTVSDAVVPSVQEDKKLVGTGAIGASEQGSSVAISADGNTAVIGAPYDSGTGAAWIFVRNGHNWILQAKLVGSAGIGYCFQGSAVSISADGNTVVIGGPGDDDYNGATWVFSRVGNTWTEEAKLKGSGNIGPANQGNAVSLSADGKTLLVGGWDDDAGLGAFWIFRKTQNGWSQEGSKMSATDYLGGFPFQGWAVALSADGKTAFIGGEGDDDFIGAVWIFNYINGQWKQKTKIFGVSSFFGHSLATNADGTVLVVGGMRANYNPGGAFVYRLGAKSWAYEGALSTKATDQADLGFSVAINAMGNLIATSDPSVNNDAGAVWLFKYSGRDWVQEGSKQTGAGAIGRTSQGHSLAMSADGNTYIEGGVTDDSRIGAAWVFIHDEHNANLSDLSISSGMLSPSFNKDSLDYTVIVDNRASSMSFTPTLADAMASVTINGTSVANGVSSVNFPLQVGNNIFTIEVTAQDGVTSKKYKVNVNRLPSSNANLSALVLSEGSVSPNINDVITSYSCQVDMASTSIVITPFTADATAHVLVNGQAISVNSPSVTMPLNVGDNTVHIDVTAEDGTVKNYTLIVRRAFSNNADLSVLDLSVGSLSPGFDPSVTDYTASVHYTYNSIRIMPTPADAKATMTIDGKAINSGTAIDINLAVGVNRIRIEVKAEDGVTIKTYTIAITRIAPSANADLSSLGISAGILSPTFNNNIVAYTVTVPDQSTGFAITPTAADPHAEIKVNGTVVASGSTAPTILLQGCTTIITISLTAQDGVTKKSYTLEVQRRANPMVTISAFSTNTCIGTAVTFTALAVDAGASPSYHWKVNNTPVGLNMASYTTSQLANHDVVTAELGSLPACANVSMVSSNPISMNVSVCTAIPPVSGFIQDVKLLPNPAFSETILRTVATKTMKIQWEVINSNGQVVMRFRQSIHAGVNDLPLVVSSLQAGVYEIMGLDDKGVSVRVRLVKL